MFSLASIDVYTRLTRLNVVFRGSGASLSVLPNTLEVPYSVFFFHNAIHSSCIRSNKRCICKLFPKSNVRYINILTWLQSFRNKIASFFCPSILKRVLDTKKQNKTKRKPNTDVFPESLEAVLKC